MREELIRGYKNFLVGSVKLFLLGKCIIQNDIQQYTQGHLKDDLIFFLCAFGGIGRNTLKTITLQDKNSFEEYVILDKTKIILSEKGYALKLHLAEKLEAHATMLEFNGLKPQYVAKINTILTRFEKFWQTLLDCDKKSQDN